MSNQGSRQASVRAATGTAYSYEGDWHALFDLLSIPNGTFNERMLSWINIQLSTTYTELNGAMDAFAKTNGAQSWNELAAFYPQNLMLWGADALLWGIGNGIHWG